MAEEELLPEEESEDEVYEASDESDLESDFEALAVGGYEVSCLCLLILNFMRICNTGS